MNFKCPTNKACSFTTTHMLNVYHLRHFVLCLHIQAHSLQYSNYISAHIYLIDTQWTKRNMKKERENNHTTTMVIIKICSYPLTNLTNESSFIIIWGTIKQGFAHNGEASFPPTIQDRNTFSQMIWSFYGINYNL